MAQIIMVLVDNRLIHGQVASLWCQHHQIDTLLVVNDFLMDNEFRKGLMNMSAPSGVETIYAHVSKVSSVLDAMPSDKRALVLCADLQDTYQVIEQVEVPKVNLGNLHMAVGKQPVATTVALDDGDKEILQKIKEKGIVVQVQRMPESEIETIEG